MTFQKKISLGIILSTLLLSSHLYAVEIDENISEDMVSFQDMQKNDKKAFVKFRRKNPQGAQERGMIETGLRPKFDESVECPNIDHQYAIDYRAHRGRESYHGGVDIPAPKKTPILAIADGVVVAKFMNESNPKGIEIVLRHSPKDTSHDKWIFTQYTHMDEMPNLQIGQKVKMADIIGSTGNTGLSGQDAKSKHGDSKYQYSQLMGNQKKANFIKQRRNLIHFGAMYSDNGKFLQSNRIFFPKDGYWMDPNAIYLKTDTLDSFELKKLPAEQKQVSIPYILEDGSIYPKDTKIIWPYHCKKK